MRYLDTRAFAERLGITCETVRRWVRKGTIVPHGRTPAGHYRFLPEQVDEVLQAQESARAAAVEAHVAAAQAKVRLLRRRIS